MHKLVEVEEAKAVMNEAKEWSMWGWLTEKRRLRTTADKAWEALGALEEKVRATWSDDLNKAYYELEAEDAVDENPKAKRQLEKAREEAKNVPPEVKAAVKRVKEAFDEAYNAHMDAEETFDVADKRMSTGMAREGALQAIDAWEMTERAIRKAEALARRK